MKDLFKLIFLNVIFSVLVLFGLFTIKVNLAENLFVHYSQHTYPLQEKLIVDQTFQASRNNLCGLQLRFKKTNDADHLVRLELKRGLRDEPDNQSLWGRFSSVKIANDNFYHFAFPAISDSKEEQFTFTLKGETATASASVSPIISDLDIYLQGEAFINGQAQPGDIVFKPVYRVSLARLISFYLNRIVFNKPLFLQKTPLLIIIACLLMGLWLIFALLMQQLFVNLKNKKEAGKALVLTLLLCLSIFILYYYFKQRFFLE